jgi:hypothetical protein
VRIIDASPAGGLRTAASPSRGARMRFSPPPEVDKKLHLH